jgi:hypothetical protein
VAVEPTPPSPPLSIAAWFPQLSRVHPLRDGAFAIDRGGTPLGWPPLPWFHMAPLQSTPLVISPADTTMVGPADAKVATRGVDEIVAFIFSFLLRSNFPPAQRRTCTQLVLLSYKLFLQPAAGVGHSAGLALKEHCRRRHATGSIAE